MQFVIPYIVIFGWMLHCKSKMLLNAPAGHAVLNHTVLEDLNQFPFLYLISQHITNAVSMQFFPLLLKLIASNGERYALLFSGIFPYILLIFCCCYLKMSC
jgi:hypothetical protein